MGAIECYACGSTLKDPVVLGRRGSMPADFNGKLTHLPRRLDGHHEQSVSAVTVGRYKKHLADFVQFLRREQLNPSTREELDAHLVSFKNSGNITRSKLEQTISALEFFVPQIKGAFKWTKRVLAGLVTAAPVKHTLPLCAMHAKFVAAMLTGQALFRLAAGLLVQTRTGLRPSELLNLRESHVMLPKPGMPRFVFRLGAAKSTKVCREQVTFLDWDRDLQVSQLLLRLLRATGTDQLLFPYTYEQYRVSLAQVCENASLSICFTPHSPRAGFATDAVTDGWDTAKIRQIGRWASERSFHTYIDVVAASQVQVGFELRGLKDSVSRCHKEIKQFFPLGCFAPEANGAPATRRGARRRLAVLLAPGGERAGYDTGTGQEATAAVLHPQTKGQNCATAPKPDRWSPFSLFTCWCRRRQGRNQRQQNSKRPAQAWR